MAALLKKLLIGTSVAVGMSAAGMAPAFAGSLTNATIGGSAPTDYLLYGVSGNQTVVIPNTPANLQSVLSGDAASPTGNVELAAKSEKANFDFSKNTTLTGNIGGLSLSLSSLTLADWTADVGGGLTFGKKWFNEALINNGYSKFIQFGGKAYSDAWNLFSTQGGFQRFSDPNISYVNQDATGKISIGLAGHYDARSLLFKGLDDKAFNIFNNMFRDPNKLTSPIQASEIVKYSYNGTAGYLYNFSATKSGLTAADDLKSHNGNYEVSLNGIIVPPPAPPAAVPEPSTMLGLMAVGGLFGLAKRNSSKKA